MSDSREPLAVNRAGDSPRGTVPEGGPEALAVGTAVGLAGQVLGMLGGLGSGARRKFVKVIMHLRAMEKGELAGFLKARAEAGEPLSGDALQLLALQLGHDARLDDALGEILKRSEGND